MAVRIQFRRGTAAEWAAANPILAAGELGYEVDTAQIKIGNGATAWNTLSYAAVSESYLNNAIADIIDLAPETLDTLNELAIAINNDPEFFNNINNTIATAEENAIVYANTVLSSAQSYADNAVANLVSSAPATLDTLNELANALGDDPNFATTISNTIGTKLTYVVDTDANYAAANAIMQSNTIYILSDFYGYVKIGDGVTRYNNLGFVAEALVNAKILEHNQDSTGVHGISDTASLVYSDDLVDYATTETTNTLSTNLNTAIDDITDLQNNVTELQNNLGDLTNTVDSINETVSDFSIDFTTTNLSATGNTILGVNTSIGDVTSTEIGYLEGATSNIQTQIDNVGTDIEALENLIGDITNTEIGYLDNVTSNIQTQLDSKLATDVAANTYAPLANASFTGSISLPSTTSIGDISSEEIGYLNNVSSNIQSQLDAKLATSSAASIYAPLTDPTFINSVVLPANTAIGSVSSAEISYLDNVSSNIQSQLDAKAPLANPTFTGTVSGITASMVGLGNVDNTTDLNKPISNATQSALDAKLNLSGGTMTGKITLDADPTQALHAATKQYVDNISAGLHVHEAVHVATTDTLANLVSSTVTYDNGTDGVGATLTLGASLTVIDGHTLNNGDRILVKEQANAAHNGIYVRTSATVLTRADDFNSAAEIAGGDFVFVENGTTYNATGWVVDNEVNTVGTDAVIWLQFSGAGTITAGSNISVNGTQVSVVSNPTFANVVTASSGVRFSDNTVQTSAGVPSRTIIVERTASSTIDDLGLIDELLEVNSSSATTVTLPTNATLAWPIGASMDILQTGTGQVTIAGAAGVTVNATPGLKLRTRWSSCTIMKRGTDSWIVYGDLTA